ncbi:Phospholipase/Carboxylesterase-domain-containing protein [Baffinella frigidus]|nr:Phospholipase/Carboxylesterase-domain-containing protein [Cryptophyta sp. CCMP2293]
MSLSRSLPMMMLSTCIAAVVPKTTAFSNFAVKHLPAAARSICSRAPRSLVPLRGPPILRRFHSIPLQAAVAAAVSPGLTSPQDWIRKAVPGDGSCMFHAVAAGLDAGYSASDLRHAAASAVSEHAGAEFNGASLAQWIEWEAGVSPDVYAQQMAAGGSWGGQIELALLARAIGRDIAVYKEDDAAAGGYAVEHSFPASGTSGVGKEPIRVLFTGSHYDALLPRASASSSSSAAPGSSRSASTASARGEGGMYGGLSGDALVAAALKGGGARRYGQLVEGHPVPEGDKHTASVIWMHGLGDSGFGWAPVATQLNMPHIKFLYPTAAVLPVTLNMGMEMPSWFDLYSLDPKDEREDQEGILASAAYVMTLVENEVAKGVARNRIVLAGFSQGGAISYTAALRMTADQPLAGTFLIQTFMRLKTSPPAPLPYADTATPFLVGHGDADPVVLYEWGAKSVDKVLLTFNTSQGTQPFLFACEMTCVGYTRNRQIQCAALRNPA